MGNPILIENAKSYATRRGIRLYFEHPLGYGTDGSVWKSNRPSAVKALERESNYRTELACYQRLKERGIRNIRGFAVPALEGYDDELLIIEMTVASPPFILDFAKAYLDRPIRHTAEVMEETRALWEELFEERWPEVRRLLAALEGMGIYYQDPKPGNISFEE